MAKSTGVDGQEAAVVGSAGGQSVIYWVAGDKGGVGKSTYARSLVDLLFSSGKPVALLEADTRNPDVNRIYNGIVPSLLTNLHMEAGWMDAMDFINDRPGHAVVVNTPAGIGDAMNREFAEFADFLNSLNPRPVVVLCWVMAPNVDSVNLLANTLDANGALFDQVWPVRNMAMARDPAQFGIWETSDVAKSLKKRGAATFDMPALHERVITRLQECEAKGDGVSFQAAIQNATDVGLSASEVSKLRSFVGNFKATFGGAVGVGG